jgi:putative ATP-dependent endonuclease of OLD family
MLEQVEIKGFRSFSQESFQAIRLHAFTVIVGENDTGKSNILKAIKMALDPSTNSISREDFNIRKSPSRTGKIVDKKASQITIKLHFSNKIRMLPVKYQRKTYHNGNIFIIKCVVSGSNKKGFKKQYYLNDRLIEPNFEELLLSKIKCFITPSIRDVDYLNELKELLPIQKSSVITQAVKKIIKVVKGKVKEQESVFKNSTNAEKAIIDPILNSQDVLDKTDFEFTIVKDGIPISLKSHGQGMISNIILSLFLKRGTNHIIGIEEPEIHMHPNMLRDIISICTSSIHSKTQIIIVTHSPYLTNFVLPKNILIARKYAKYTRISKIIPPNPEVSRKIERNVFLNRHKTEMLFAKGVLLVEGPYDRRVFTLIDDAEGILTFRYGISIIDVGGDGFEPYIELCIQSNIPWGVIADSKAFYSPENDRRGNLLRTVEKYTTTQFLQLLENRIARSQTIQREMKILNLQLERKKGYLVHLSGADISDTIIEALAKKNDNNLYRKLFLIYGGHSNVTDPTIIKSKVEAKIREKKDEMLDAVKLLKKPNELERALKNTFNNLISLSKR